MAEEKEKTSVTFFTVADSYPPNKDLTVGFKCPSSLQVSSSDWVGIFKVGWVSTRDYYTFEWVNWSGPVEEEAQKVGSVTFAGRRIPPSDGSMYQFCYVGKGYALKGCSRPFVISAEATDVGLVDAEFVEITNDDIDQLRSMVVINTTPSDKKGGVPAAVLEMKEKVTKISEEKDEITKQLEAANQTIATLQEELIAKQKGFDSVQEQTKQVVKEAEEKQTLLNDTVKNLKEEKMIVLEQLSDISSKLEEENAALKASKAQLEEANSGLLLEIEKTKASLDSTYEDLKASEASRSDLVTSKLSLEQEIKTMKENTVSKDAFEALQKAQQSIQESSPMSSMAIISDKEMLEAKNEELVTKLRMCKEEYTQKCYEVRDLQKQLASMKASGQAPSNSSEAIDGVMEELESRREKCKELEEKNSAFEEMNSLLEEKVMSNDRTISDLKEEKISLEDKIEQIVKDKDEEIALLNQQVIQQTEELASIRETNATKEQQKNNAIASLTAQLESKEREIAILKSQPSHPAPQQYPQPQSSNTHRLPRNQPQGHPRNQPSHPQSRHQSRPPVAATATPSSKDCPMCQVKFPTSVSNAEFEAHVQSHFDY